MSWFAIALAGPVLYAFSNHIDKYLVSKYLPEGEAGALIIFSSIFSVVAIPVVVYIDPTVLSVTLAHAVALVLNSILVVLAVLLYYYALQQDEASYVIPYYQLIPIFAFGLGYFVLGESLSLKQLLASMIIIFGTISLSFDFGIHKIRFKRWVVIFMSSASFFYALNGVVFKLIAENEGFWPSLFWGFTGKVLFGIFMYCFVATYRSQFQRMMNHGGLFILGINSLSEFFFLIAESITQFAILLAPVALIMLVNSFQPFFVFVFGIILTVFFPKITSESIEKKQLIQKTIGIGLIVIGTIVLGK